MNYSIHNRNIQTTGCHIRDYENGKCVFLEETEVVHSVGEFHGTVDCACIEMIVL